MCIKPMQDKAYLVLLMSNCVCCCNFRLQLRDVISLLTKF